MIIFYFLKMCETIVLMHIMHVFIIQYDSFRASFNKDWLFQDFFSELKENGTSGEKVSKVKKLGCLVVTYPFHSFIIENRVLLF